ncbi:hypothetical protein CRYUN_Cryun07bG0007900 [Craigia yunnanensis]
MEKIGSSFINPEHDFIPLSDKSSTDAPFKFLTFINHPSGLKSPHYKVVCVRDPDPWLDFWNDPESSYMTQQVEIYSSQTRSWRLSGKPFIAPVNTGFNGGSFAMVPFTGLIHGIEEKLKQLPMPPIPDDWEDIRREADDEESYMVLHIPDKAIQYNLKDGSLKKICDFAPDDNDNRGSPTLISLRYFWADQFIQTLFCLSTT